jgi:hypothetical protein
LAGKASTPHPAVIAAIIVNYIAIPHRFLATEHTNIIVFMPPKRATPAPPPESARKSSRPATFIKKKVAFQSKRDRRAAEREKAAREKAEKEKLEKAERLTSLETDVLDELLRDEQNRTKARIKKAREMRNKVKDLQQGNNAGSQKKRFLKRLQRLSVRRSRTRSRNNFVRPKISKTPLYIGLNSRNCARNLVRRLEMLKNIQILTRNTIVVSIKTMNLSVCSNTTFSCIKRHFSTKLSFILTESGLLNESN